MFHKKMFHGTTKKHAKSKKNQKKYREKVTTPQNRRRLGGAGVHLSTPRKKQKNATLYI